MGLAGLAWVIMLHAGGAADAGVVYAVTERSARAGAGSQPDIPLVERTSTSAGRWTEANFQSPSFGEPAGGGSYVGGAGRGLQDTLLSETELSGRVESAAWDGNQGFGGQAESVLTAVFTVSTPTPFRASGTWSASDPFSTPAQTEVALASIALSGPSGFGWTHGIGQGTYAGSFDEGGTLAPGVYTLSVSTWARVRHVGTNLGVRTGRVDFVMLVPGPGTGVVLGGVVIASAIGRRRR